MTPVSSSIKCIFVGDLAMGDHPKSVGFGFYSKYKNGIPVDKALSLLPKGYGHDILFGNLEFNLGNDALDGTSHDELNCRGIAGYAEYLRHAGFNVVNIANNHIYQHGIAEFTNTQKILTDNGIGIVGLRNNSSLSNVVSLADESVCLLGWSARPRQGFVEQPPYQEFDELICYDAIVEAKKKYSYVCVSMHWGEEFIEIPSDKEKLIARKMIDSGASVVIGHHPHVIREVEEYNGGLIAYSLGNFICDMVWNEKTRKTGYLYVELADSTILRWEMVYGRIDDSFFPDFSKGNPDLSANYRDLYDKVETSSYFDLARYSLRHHQVLTVLHMLRNCFRYRPTIWLSMLFSAVKNRLMPKTSEGS